MAQFILTIRGDQLGTFKSVSGVGNGGERVVTVSGTQPFGTASQIFTVIIDQADPSATQFANGQLITIRDASGAVVMTQTGVQPDIEQGLGAGDEHLIIAQSGFLIDLQGIQTGSMVYGATSQPASTNLGDNDGELDFADVRTSFPCFALGTRIATPAGQVPVESLSLGDWVCSHAGPAVRLIWVGRRTIALPTPGHPQRPIRIGRGRLDDGAPALDLFVSPQHRILVHSARQGTPDVLVAAKALTHLPGIRPAFGQTEITYVSLLTSHHAILTANGAPAESFYPGAYMLGRLPPFQRLQVLAACPALRTDPQSGYGPPARPRLSLAQARRVIAAPGQARSSLGLSITT